MVIQGSCHYVPRDNLEGKYTQYTAGTVVYAIVNIDDSIQLKCSMHAWHAGHADY